MALGWRQADCLQMMLERGGSWHPRCGWFYGDSKVETFRIMRALERRGLVQMNVTSQRIGWFVPDPERAFAAITAAQMTEAWLNRPATAQPATPARPRRR
jgi:hypothetical protein